MTPAKCPTCGGQPKKVSLIDEFPIDATLSNHLYWATCRLCGGCYRQRVIRSKL